MPARRKGGETASVSSQKTPACLPLHFRLDAPSLLPDRQFTSYLEKKKRHFFRYLFLPAVCGSCPGGPSYSSSCRMTGTLGGSASE